MFAIDPKTEETGVRLKINGDKVMLGLHTLEKGEWVFFPKTRKAISIPGATSSLESSLESEGEIKIPVPIKSKENGEIILAAEEPKPIAIDKKGPQLTVRTTPANIVIVTDKNSGKSYLTVLGPNGVPLLPIAEITKDPETSAVTINYPNPVQPPNTPTGPPIKTELAPENFALANFLSHDSDLEIGSSKASRESKFHDSTTPATSEEPKPKAQPSPAPLKQAEQKIPTSAEKTLFSECVDSKGRDPGELLEKTNELNERVNIALGSGNSAEHQKLLKEWQNLMKEAEDLRSKKSICTQKKNAFPIIIAAIFFILIKMLSK